MEHPLVTSDRAVPPKVDANALLTKKRQIRALKRVLIAKAEIRRLKSLVGLRRVTAR